ncbi:hypothetical protein L6164_003485 [Bauhinia variegata]|uniref:Uncharacterized protein n=1 Tax=Bauhinia variegata TaxID=167791 RepID=A0ACB9Q1J5_BAUVA|nr:hypothetical protein L6164_003485 [Bauhinia variegata]
MSFNQSRSDKNDTQYRKSGRSGSSNQQRGSSGAFVKGGGGGPAPSPSITSGSSLSSNRSFKKSNNAQGGQSGVNPSTVNSTESTSASTSRTIQNGTHVQPKLHASDAPVTNASAKSNEPSTTQRSTRTVPKAPTSQPPPMSSDPAAPTTPAKTTGDASKTFPFQFGTLSPGFMNGMAIPARTSSAPPNLDEQKQHQALHESYRSVVPSVPTPPVPKQQPPRKDAGVADQSNSREANPGTRVKKDPQVSPSPHASQMQKPFVVPMTGISMPMPFHQSQVQQQVFLPRLQPHPMHSQGIMQAQNMSFTPQMGHQLPHQLGNMGISTTPQYPQQQGGKFGGPRKTTVKITHPETHEELRLDKRADTYSEGVSSGARSHPNVPSQSQPVQSFGASHPTNYYPPSSYNTSSLFFQSPNSLPLTSSQITPNSQAPRFNYQVNHGPQNVSFINPSSLSSVPVGKTGAPILGVPEPASAEHSRDVHNVILSAPPAASSVTIKPSSGSGVEKSESPSSSGASSDAPSSVPQRVVETHADISSQPSKSSSEASNLLPKQSAAASVAPSTENLTTATSIPALNAVSEDSVSAGSNNEGKCKESLSRSNSLKDNQKKPGKKGQSQHQVAVQSHAVATVPSEGGVSDNGVSESVKSKANHSNAICSDDIPATEDIPSTTGGSVNCSMEVSGSQSVDSLNNQNHDKLEKLSQHDKLLDQNIPEMSDNNDRRPSEGPKQNFNDSGSSVESVTLKSIKCEEPEEDAAKLRAEVLTPRTVQQGKEESISSNAECDKMGENLGMSTFTVLDSRDAASLSRSDSVVSTESANAYFGASDQQSSSATEASSNNSKDSAENSGSGSASLPLSGTKDKPVFEPNKVKATSKNKKKRREYLQKADAAGSTSDLYNAYKGPEEKKETVVSAESTESTSPSGSSKQLPTDAAQPDAIASEKVGQGKAEPDDWEDAADMSTPKLEVSDKMLQDGSGSTAKKYSRDFLLKFAEQCTDLPEAFEIRADIAEVLMSSNISGSHVLEREPYPSPGRSGVVSRMDRRGSGVIEEDRWNKASVNFTSGRDMRLDTGFGGNVGFRPSPGGNFGVLRNPRVQSPVQYSGGILAGPMQSMGPQGGIQRNNPDGERWQRANNFQRGLIPSPSQAPLQMMHKAEKKYEVGKVTDEEEAKQRQLKAILNKLTPQNFEKLFEQVKAVNIDNAMTLTGVISQIFEKALMEPTFCEMYANFCLHLASELPDFSEDNEKITFKRLLLNKCQEEFERGEREQEEANKVDEGEVKQSAEAREEKRTKARRRMLGNIRLIGELYKKKMLTERIMHECIQKLLGQYQDPDEEDVEALCKLMSTIGEMIDHPKAKEHMDLYFERMKLFSNNMNLSSRVRFMLKDTIDLRKNRWQQKRKVEGPKKIEEVHRDAAQDRQLQTGRMGRGPGSNASGRRMPMDFGSRGSPMLSSPNAQIGGMRGLPTQGRGFGSQDVRFDDRQSYEARTLSMPLPQRTLGDDSITLGPQGGLARGMSLRGATTFSSPPVSDVSTGPGDSRRMSNNPNGYGHISERAPTSSREDLVPRYIPDRFAGPTAYEQSSSQERNMNYGSKDLRNADRSFDRPIATSPARVQVQGPTVSQNASSDKVWPEERLRDMSIAAIKEFYSAVDEKEVALCVKEMNSPSFHPTMVSLWVADSFERKNPERDLDLLAKLLVNLSKSQDGTLNQAELMKGFESVLATLEDAVTDAPRAPEFLGRIFARVITENVVSLREIGRLIHEGGEEPGLLLEVGLAADVLGSTLEAIKLEKGDAFLNEIRTNSNLKLESFRPPDPIKSRKLEKFL